MPVYFFDVDDGEHKVVDTVGSDLKGVVEARNEAIAVLPDIARDVLPDGDRRTMKCQVRDESGRLIFRASLSLVAEWLT